MVLGAALLFSTGGVAIKATSWDGFAVAAGRSAVAVLVLLVVMPNWRRFWQPKAMLVGTAFGATLVLFVLANKLTGAANAIFLQATAPLYVLVLGPWLLGEHNRRSDVVLTLALALGMSLFFVGHEPPAETASNPALGNAIASAAGFTWACTLVGLRWIARRPPHEPIQNGSNDLAGAAVVAGNLVAVLICLPLALPLPATTPADLAWVVYLGVFQIGVAYLLLNRGIERLPALETALLLLLEPVLASVLAWWVLGEQPGPWVLAGCGVILAATVARTLLATTRSIP